MKSGMLDHGSRPVGDLLRGPLLHTPQGIALLIVALSYWLAAAALALDWVSLPPALAFESPALACAVWPLLMFLMFVRHGSPAFEPSWGETAWMIVYAAIPVAFFAWWR
jgi:hypothetical protein